jgi:hypothetical protein
MISVTLSSWSSTSSGPRLGRDPFVPCQLQARSGEAAVFVVGVQLVIGRGEEQRTLYRIGRHRQTGEQPAGGREVLFGQGIY